MCEIDDFVKNNPVFKENTLKKFKAYYIQFHFLGLIHSQGGEGFWWSLRKNLNQGVANPS